MNGEHMAELEQWRAYSRVGAMIGEHMAVLQQWLES